MNVSRETADSLEQYESLIAKWNKAINLVAPTTISDLRHRHIEDSAQIFEIAKPQGGRWLDLGSGGGLPGIVIAIQARHLPLSVTLVESDKRKSAFLNTARRELRLDNVSVKPERIEAISPGAYDFVSARALASLTELMPQLNRQLASHGEAWLLKGRSWQQEVADARKDWSFDLESHPSVTDPEAALIALRNIKPNA